MEDARSRTIGNLEVNISPLSLDMALTCRLDHAHVRTNLGDPGYECPVCGGEPRPEPVFYSPIPEHPLFTENDRLQWQLDAYRNSASYARFLNRWREEGIPRYEYTHRLTMNELLIDLYYLSNIFEVWKNSRNERYAFRLSQLSCKAFLKEWRALGDDEAEPAEGNGSEPQESRQADTQPETQARQADTQPQAQAPQPIPRRVSTLNAYTAFRGEFIPGASSWSSNHRSRREAARARTEFFQQRRAPGNPVNTNQRPYATRRPNRSHQIRRSKVKPAHSQPPLVSQHEVPQANALGNLGQPRRPMAAYGHARNHLNMQAEELARMFQGVNLAENQPRAQQPM